MNSTIRVVETKALISCAVTAQLICVFVFAYANRWFSHAKAQLFLYAQGIPFQSFVFVGSRFKEHHVLGIEFQAVSMISSESDSYQSRSASNRS